MTRPLGLPLKSDGLAGPEAIRGRADQFEPATAPREQRRFRGCETLWGGYTFLVWTLAANPQGRREVGARFAVFVG